MLDKSTLAGRTILVTGGGSGLGLAMARQFGALGARVAICGRDAEKLGSAARTIESVSAPVLTHALDVRDYDAVGRMFDAFEGAGAPIDGLVNNAAGNFLCASEELTPGGFKSIVDIVLHGTFNCTHQFGKRVIGRGGKGDVLNIATTYAETGAAFLLPSACAKAGVQALTMSLAYEWAEYGIRVNAIAPGPIPTEGAWSRLIPGKGYEEEYRKRLPTRRFGKPEELANLAAFLMSGLAPYITGECIAIDGAEKLQGAQFNFLANAMPRKDLKALFAQIRPPKKAG